MQQNAKKLSFFFIIQHTVAVALKIRVVHLLAKFAADTAVFLAALYAAGAVAPRGVQPVFYGAYYFRVAVKAYFAHFDSPMRARTESLSI